VRRPDRRSLLVETSDAKFGTPSAGTC
jgi:hypothetical protein